jgi:hypothetical protein
VCHFDLSVYHGDMNGKSSEPNFGLVKLMKSARTTRLEPGLASRRNISNPGTVRAAMRRYHSREEVHMLESFTPGRCVKRREKSFGPSSLAFGRHIIKSVRHTLAVVVVLVLASAGCTGRAALPAISAALTVQSDCSTASSRGYGRRGCRGSS